MCRVHHGKCWAGWVTSWNQDCREKYSQPHISRWYHSNGRKWRRTKEPLDECERGEWKNWLNTQHLKKKTQGHGIWSHHFMTKRRGKNGSSGKFSSSWALKSLADDDCSLGIRRSLLLGRKVMTNLDSVWKSKDITVLIKVHIVKAMFFPIVMCRYESWTIRKAEHQRYDAVFFVCFFLVLFLVFFF